MERLRLADQFKKDEAYDGQHRERTEDHDAAKHLICHHVFPDAQAALGHDFQLFQRWPAQDSPWLAPQTLLSCGKACVRAWFA